MTVYSRSGPTIRIIRIILIIPIMRFVRIVPTSPIGIGSREGTCEHMHRAAKSVHGHFGSLENRARHFRLRRSMRIFLTLTESKSYER